MLHFLHLQETSKRLLFFVCLKDKKVNSFQDQRQVSTNGTSSAASGPAGQSADMPDGMYGEDMVDGVGAYVEDVADGVNGDRVDGADARHEESQGKLSSCSLIVLWYGTLIKIKPLR